MSVQAVPGFDLQPSAQQVATRTNYITNFDFLSQYLPDTYEKEFERYGNRSVASFLRMVGAEMPTNSDLIKWAEQGRLHSKYTGMSTPAIAGAPTCYMDYSFRTSKSSVSTSIFGTSKWFWCNKTRSDSYDFT